MEPLVIGDDGPETPLRLVGPLVDYLVLGLGGAHPVVADLLVEVGLLVGLPGLRLLVPAVEEAQVVRGPLSRGELHPLEVVVEVHAGLDVPDPPVLPVGARGGEPVGDKPPVVADGRPREGDGPVLGEGVGVDEGLGLVLQGAHAVEDALVLQPVVPGEEVDPALLVGDAELFVVPELGHPPAYPLPCPDLPEVAECQLVLGVDPCPGLLGVDLLEPPVGVGDLDAVDDVDVVRLPALWIPVWAC